ncbi:Arylsulfatase precursor [Roseimaritima multifibrata]|uniref:Arylsulfatase n=1 Tax=Roseimaritima multifibrata TaxID=1930274 RepID=A0A517MHT2_9BACT|nr:arylsulfatase [Roseimaritima multifibrata]QDS94436.1 Arylsulfatase precursor [Roseimaritima multifibrata]
MRRRIVPLILSAVAAFTVLGDQRTPLLAESNGHPNIVVILVDDLGYGDPGCFNKDSKIPTPNIDSLANAGMKFTDAHAPGPLCHMSRYGLLTGRYPFRTDVSRWPTEPLIGPEQWTIATVAKQAGYETAMVGKWHVGFKERGYEKPLAGGPVDHGFDRYFGIRASTDIPPYFYIRDDHAVMPPTETIAANNSPGWSPIQGAFWRAGKIAPDLQLDGVLKRFTDEAIDVVESHVQGESAAKPLMLYLAYPAPHSPWLPSDEFVGKSGAGMYGDFLMMVDAEIGRITQSLENHKLADDTLLIFTSDNGPCWYDKDVAKYNHDSSGGLRGMKGDAWEGGHRMPFIVRWPGKVAKGTSNDQLICFTDFLATFAAMLDVTLPEDAGPDSISFLPTLTGDTPQHPLRQQFVLQPGSGPSMLTIRDQNWKLITGLGSGGFSKPSRRKPTGDGITGQLYDLKSDPGETKNLFKEHPEKVADLQEKLNQARAGSKP